MYAANLYIDSFQFFTVFNQFIYTLFLTLLVLFNDLQSLQASSIGHFQFRQIITPEISFVLPSNSKHNLSTFVNSAYDFNEIKLITFKFEAFENKFELELERKTTANKCNFSGSINEHELQKNKTQYSLNLAYFNLCKGLTGVFQWKLTDYFLEPVRNKVDKIDTTSFPSYIKQGTKLLPHIISYYSINRTKPILSCSLIHKSHNKKQHQSHSQSRSHNVYKHHADKFTNQITRRRKRLKRSIPTFTNSLSSSSSSLLSSSTTFSSSFHSHTNQKLLPVVHSDIEEEHIIELLIVVTSNMRSRFRDNLNQYILNNIEIAMRVLRHPSLEASISINVVDIISLDPEYEKKYNLHDWSSLGQEVVVNTFCEWVSMKKKTSRYHWDSAILINNGYFCCSAIGIAHLRSMCSSKNCLALVDRGFGTGYIIAHELAHQLNAPHDHDEEELCVNFERKLNDSDKINTVMATSLYFENYPFVWSECSRRSINHFLKSDEASCLKTQNTLPVLYTHDNMHQFSTGKQFDLDQQCSYALREQATHCNTQKQLKKCTSLYCQSDRYNTCFAVHAVIADGTSCDDGKHCIHGSCVSVSDNIRAIDGGWSEYGPWSDCTRKCDGGVEFSNRLCNNPVPVLGGKYCVGPRERIRSCNIQPCKNQSNPRQELCQTLNLKAYTPRADDDSRCHLVCLDDRDQSVDHGLRLIDGTPCSPETTDICVKERCYRTGCDRIVGSKKEYDMCNICGGHNNTCFKIEHLFDQSDQKAKNSMYWAFDIPKGVTNIYLEKTSQRTTPYSSAIYDDFLILLMSDLTTSIRRSKSQEKYVGGILYYSGSDIPKETIRITGEIKRPITVLIRTANMETTFNLPIIYYSYYVPHSHPLIDKYFEWRIIPLNSKYCIGNCNGLRSIHSLCFEKDTNEQVSNEYCNYILRPSMKAEGCLDSCGFRWHKPSNDAVKEMKTHSCSVRCGRSSLDIYYTCQRKTNYYSNFYKTSNSGNMIWKVIDENQCYKAGLDKRPFVRVDCVGRCLPLSWNVGSWKNCSVLCGTGYRTRDISCQDTSGRYWSYNECVRDFRFRHLKSSNQSNVLGIPATNETCHSYELCSDESHWSTGAWQQCSVSCGEGIQARQVRCINQFNKTISYKFCKSHSIQPISIRSCQLPDCFRWYLITNNKCSVTCGVGVMNSKYICMSITPVDNEKHSKNIQVDDSFCIKSGLPIPQIPLKRCILKGCSTYSWMTMDWGKCSTICGNGVRYRQVRCGLFNINNNTVIKWTNPKHCNQKLRPISAETCVLRPCPEWRYSPWSKCDGKCLFGKKYRIIFCYDKAKQAIAHDSECNLKEKKPMVKKCLLSNLCGYWSIGSWSRCSQSCGLGVKNRSIQCKYTNGTISTDISYCKSPTPFQRVYCENPACSNKPFWWLLKYSQCYAYKCNPGIMYVDVRCVNSGFDILPNSMCTTKDNDPIYHIGCLGDNCLNRFWSAPDWDTISCKSNSCMMEIKNRPVTCRDDFGNVFEDRLCDEHTKPDTWRVCSIPRNCSDIPRSCKELKALHPESGDGEYSIAIDLNWTYFIFCADMDTDHPKEYLTLKKLNYARSSRFININSSGTINQTSCQYQTDPNEHSCKNCQKNYNLLSITRYYKIRLNMTDLSVDIMDNRYAKTSGTSFIPYGTAKDCSGSVKCPRGHFLIDLSGTEFTVSMQTRWHNIYDTHTYRIIREDNSKMVNGWCGGDCDGCSPLPKLFIEPQMYGRNYNEISRFIYTGR